MDESRFWALVGETTQFAQDQDRQLRALRETLDKLSSVEIEAFEATFDRLMKRSFSWDLWGAAYVVNGGASDDGFEYFRCWLISRGEPSFRKALADPDSLADMIPRDADSALDFEPFAYVARTVWSQKTGKPEIPNAALMMYPGVEPTGAPFAEDAGQLAKRYPKLWQRFGNSPLQ